MIFRRNFRGNVIQMSRKPTLGTVFSLFFFFLLALNAGAQELSQPSTGVTFSFDPGFDPLVPAKRSATGEILVQPSVNGQEAGWFRLDPAVEGMRISAELAQSLGLVKSGTVRLITSSNKMEERPVWSGARFQLGPLLAEGLEFAELGETGAPAEEETIAGVVGTAVLQAAIVELDMDGENVRFYDPAAYQNGTVAWQPFSLENGLPALDCRWEGDREAKFGLDLRSPLGLLFFSETVASLELLKDRPGRPVKVSGATFSRASAQTASLEWFEAAGLRLETPQAVFLTEPTGLAVEKNLAGVMGREALKGCLLVMDYAQKRLTVLKKAEGS